MQKKPRLHCCQHTKALFLPIMADLLHEISFSLLEKSWKNKQKGLFRISLLLLHKGGLIHLPKLPAAGVCSGAIIDHRVEMSSTNSYLH